MAYEVVLRACRPEILAEVAQAVSQAFGIKDTTSLQVVQSAPIVLIGDLTETEAAAMTLALKPIELAGASLDYIADNPDVLPKIDWPKRPKIFKQPLPNFAALYAMDLPVGGEHRVPLIDLLIQALTGKPNDSGGYVPQELDQQAEVRTPGRQPFVGADLGEITPFSNPILPTAGGAPAKADAKPDAGSVANRMDELFPEEGGMVPSSKDITNIIDKLLPEDDSVAVQSGTGSLVAPAQPGTSANTATGTGSITAPGSGCSLFLNKFTDENRRKKVVPLIAELVGISEEEADKLSKKMIIPILKGVAKEEAEKAKHRFAEIGVLARVR